MIADRKLTLEEKEKHRQWQVDELLRRRFGNPEGAAEAMAEVDAEVAARLAAKPAPKGPPRGPSAIASCPDCGTPYRKGPGRKRCYHCRPEIVEPVCIKCGKPRGAAKQGRCFRCEFEPVTEPAVVVTPESEATDHFRVIPKMVEVGGNGKPESEATDHLRDDPKMIEPAAGPEYSPPIPECAPAIPEYFVPLRNIDVPVPDHVPCAGNMVKPDPIVALRRVVDALDGLDRDAVRWVLQSAARLPRPDNSESRP